MPRWGGWTSDLEMMSEVFGQYHPERRDQMRAAVAVVRAPTTDVSVLAMLIDDLGQWLAAEYLAAHGPKTPRQG